MKKKKTTLEVFLEASISFVLFLLEKVITDSPKNPNCCSSFSEG